jgi:hypothetical protein
VISISGTQKADALFSMVSSDRIIWVEVVPTSNPTERNTSATPHYLIENASHMVILGWDGIGGAAGICQRSLHQSIHFAGYIGRVDPQFCQGGGQTQLPAKSKQGIF